MCYFSYPILFALEKTHYFDQPLASNLTTDRRRNMLSKVVWPMFLICVGACPLLAFMNESMELTCAF